VTKEVIKEVVRLMRQQGIGCGELERLAEMVETNKVPWERVLRASISGILATIRHGTEDYTYAIPSRRQPPSEVIFPSMVDTKFKVLVVVDTSGSMSEKDLGAALKQVKEIVERAGIEAIVAAGDWDLQRMKEVKDRVKWRALEKGLVGGGGTDMVKVSKEAMEKAKNKVGLIVILTDGETTWEGFDDLLKVPVVVGIINNPSAVSKVPKLRKVRVVEI